ncbi:MAG: flippase-like domain-containing protein, partial [Candidatus Delongbacteria bacterium]|nr:flippase-like domain-containing protein [Candidatus Delongbacteria bacterium]
IDFMLLSGVMLIGYINTFFAVNIQLNMLEVKEKKSNILFLALATNLLNYLPAKGGMLSLGTFLKVKKKVPLNKFVFTTMLIYIVVTLVTLLLSLFFLFDEKMLRVYNRINFVWILIVILFTIVAVMSAYIFAKKNKNNKLSQYYLLFVSNKNLILKNKLNLFYTILAIIGGIAVFSIRMYISFGIAGYNISFYHAFLIGVIANLSFFLSFTPGGLGVKEGFVAGITFLLFGNAGIGVVASLVDRAVNLILTIITGLVAIKYLDKQYFSKKTERL